MRYSFNKRCRCRLEAFRAWSQPSSLLLRPPPRPPEVYWLIAKSEAGRTQILTVDPNGRGEALAVFGFEDEARIFFWHGTLGAAWRLKETTAGELIRMLLGPCADVGFVALDPLPEIVSRRMVGLVSLSRERFVAHLIERAEPLVSRAGEGTFVEKETRPESKLAPLPEAHAGLHSGQTGSRLCRPARAALS